MGPHADVGGTRARDLADFGQLLAHLGGMGYQPDLDQRLDVLGDLDAALGVMVGKTPPPGLVPGLHGPGVVGIIGPCPTPGVVPGVAQRVEMFFVPGRGDVQ